MACQASNRRQAIIWTNADLIHWRMHIIYIRFVIWFLFSQINLPYVSWSLHKHLGNHMIIWLITGASRREIPNITTLCVNESIRIFNSLSPSATIWQHTSGSILAWRHEDITWTSVELSSSVLCGIHLKGNSPEGKFTRSANEINPYHVLGDYTFEIATQSPRGQWVNITITKQSKRNLCLYLILHLWVGVWRRDEVGQFCVMAVFNRDHACAHIRSKYLQVITW